MEGPFPSRGEDGRRPMCTLLTGAYFVECAQCRSHRQPLRLNLMFAGSSKSFAAKPSGRMNSCIEEYGMCDQKQLIALKTKPLVTRLTNGLRSEITQMSLKWWEPQWMNCGFPRGCHERFHASTDVDISASRLAHSHSSYGWWVKARDLRSVHSLPHSWHTSPGESFPSPAIGTVCALL